MAHEHHNHGHSHSHTITLTSVSKAFVIGIALNALFVVIEAVVGFASHSLALLTDAGHNLSDVASLALSLLAFRLAKMKRTDTYTFGYHKTTILAALFNAVILLVAIGGIAWEAIKRINHPEPMQGGTIAIVAFIGIIINSVTAYLFFRQGGKELNVRGAYLHLAADAAVSLGVVISGIIIVYTNWYWIDTVLSFVIAIVIFISTWRLLKQTLRLSLDGVPLDVDLYKVRQAALAVDGVKDIHHVHAWAIGTSRNALTAHLVINDLAKAFDIKKVLRHKLEHLNVHHSTLETELDDGMCSNEHCDVKQHTHDSE